MKVVWPKVADENDRESAENLPRYACKFIPGPNSNTNQKEKSIIPVHSNLLD
ncbi:MAG: hypothetical protein ACI9Y1_002558 [Lentisphaeria bacterium]|jgi:hypothetical protein